MINKSGFINILKPTGMTSADVVFAVKKILKPNKIGHLGTLDPAAAGVLPIAIGKGTKFFDYFLNKDKVYIARVKFGIETDTLDSFGIVLRKDNLRVTKEQILAVLPKFLGKIKQVPPKYSAIKINGRRACDLARENIEFEIKSKEIEVFSIDLLSDCGNNEFMFKVHCSSGTYIRTLFSDIAYSLNTISTTPVIIRAKSGRFDINSAIMLEELTEEKIVSIKEVFYGTQTIEVDECMAKKFINGVKVFSGELKTQPEAEFFISYKNIIIGLYKIENELIKPIVYLYEVQND